MGKDSGALCLDNRVRNVMDYSITPISKLLDDLVENLTGLTLVVFFEEPKLDSRRELKTIKQIRNAAQLQVVIFDINQNGLAAFINYITHVVALEKFTSITIYGLYGYLDSAPFKSLSHLRWRLHTASKVLTLTLAEPSEIDSKFMTYNEFMNQSCS
ncbi:unnamed protein product [Kuraishia capsulata CBS 1993]|uniref:Uncharacterized protein n=1 Tax=Kuraishia capsulata CBS 1993 TaxID=1382522 RepID=W6MQD3_9ASCO|nr:uncharacterized protein KUCA_T00000060001 [Kuraishia capsulata CBS 1993]CDK24100.1 unnamed protein product [Kuraishia capsulata CBS 1993]